MNILLWIALIGVIVFLLGLIYSKISSNSAKQPAGKTIIPADTLPSPAAKTEKTPSTKDNDRPNLPVAANATDLIAPLQKPIENTVLAKKVETLATTIPAAEPVGPAHSNTKADKTAAIKAIVPSAPALPAAPPVLPSKPERLTKPRGGKADDLTQITGIGKAIQTKLFDSGIFHYSQLTELNALQTEWLNSTIGFSGRAERENWGMQAKKLAVKSATTAQAPVKRVVKTAAKTTATKAKPTAKPKTAKKS